MLHFQHYWLGTYVYNPRDYISVSFSSQFSSKKTVVSGGKRKSSSNEELQPAFPGGLSFGVRLSSGGSGRTARKNIKIQKIRCTHATAGGSKLWPTIAFRTFFFFPHLPTLSFFFALGCLRLTQLWAVGKHINIIPGMKPTNFAHPTPTQPTINYLNTAKIVLPTFFFSELSWVELWPWVMAFVDSCNISLVCVFQSNPIQPNTIWYQVNRTPGHGVVHRGALFFWRSGCWMLC